MDSYEIRNKIIKFLIAVFVLIIIINIIIYKILKVQINEQNENNNKVLTRIDEIKNDEYYFDGLILKLTEKDRDWSNLPLSKKFLSKYNIENGIFNNNKLYGYNVTNDITFCEFDELHNNSKNILSIEVATGNGDEIIAYKLHYIINDKYELDDIEVLETAPITKPDGTLIMYDKILTLKNDYIRIIEKLLYPTYFDPYAEGPFYNEVLSITDNFKLKYPKYDTDGIIEELGFKEAGYYGNYFALSQDERNELKKEEHNNVFYGYTLFDDKMNIYKLKFVLDKDGKIDDCVVELARTIEGDFTDVAKDW